MHRVLGWTLAVLLIATGAAAQETTTGSITGRVTDPQGLPLPGVTVTITSPQGERTYVTDAQGKHFAADGNFDGGKIITSAEPIARTESQALYQTARQGEFSYTAQVSPGRSYTLQLYFAELSQKFSRKRAVSVSVNQQKVLENYNLTRRAGMSAAFTVVRRNIWPDDNGQIRLDFTGKKGGGICSAISIY